MVVIGLIGAITVDIWATVDAVRVAKVNNLAWRDKYNTGYNIRLEPYIATMQTSCTTNLQAGLSLKLNF